MMTCLALAAIATSWSGPTIGYTWSNRVHSIAAAADRVAIVGRQAAVILDAVLVDGVIKHAARIRPLNASDLKDSFL
jgi:hypothetical protein